MVNFAEVPKLPSRLMPQTANFIRDIGFHGCARPWYVYVEAFAPAFIELLFTLAFLDLEDIIRMRGEAIARQGKGIRKPTLRHLRRRPIKTINRGAKRYGSKGLKVLLVVTLPLEILGFAFLLYFAVDNFYGNWQALIERSDFCKQPIESGPFTRQRTGGRVSVLPGCVGVGLPDLRQNRGGWSSTAFAVSLPQGQFRAYFGLTVTGPVGGITNVRLRFFIVGGLGGFAVEGEPVSIAAGESIGLLVNATFFLPGFAGGSLAWELCGPAVPVGLESEDGFLTISRFG